MAEALAEVAEAPEAAEAALRLAMKMWKTPVSLGKQSTTSGIFQIYVVYLSGTIAGMIPHQIIPMGLYRMQISPTKRASRI